MAKQRTLNEIRQSKEYQVAKEKVMIDSIDKLHYATKNPFDHEDVEKTVNKIVEDLDGNIYDLIFQAVCDEMNEHYVFDSSEYLTESGLELFEDEWFEFYHENHGKIIHKLIQKLK